MTPSHAYSFSIRARTWLPIATARGRSVPADERVRRSTRAAFELYARYWYDSFRIRSITRATINARVDVSGLHHVDAALANGKGCLAVLPHMGNWDVAGRFLAVNGYRIAAVAEELRPAHDPSACDAYGYVDTVAVYGGWVPFDVEPMKSVSNQYAAMPSVHVGWALWAAVTVVSLTRRRAVRALAIAHPLVTVFVIVVTANHYWIDAIGGALCLVAGSLVAEPVTLRRRGWGDRRFPRQGNLAATVIGRKPLRP